MAHPVNIVYVLIAEAFAWSVRTHHVRLGDNFIEHLKAVHRNDSEYMIVSRSIGRHYDRFDPSENAANERRWLFGLDASEATWTREEGGYSDGTEFFAGGDCYKSEPLETMK
jgi:hypothetical protein